MKSEEPLDATPLAEDDRKGLIPEHITTRNELNTVEFANINKACLKYFSKIPTQLKAPFTAEWLKKLHYEMFGEVWRWAGKPRIADIVPGIPVHQISVELLNFERDFIAWKNHQHEPYEVAAKIHHRLVWIHPFRNGNGRWARTAANIYLKQKKLPLVKWPEDVLFIKSGFRNEYILALRKADKGDFSSLIKLHEALIK
jgi:Fic-DOC domain mobile mystery protein B